MSCYTGFFNVWRGWQSLNTGPRFYLRLIRRTGWLWISTSRTTDGFPFKPKKLSVPFLYPGVPAGLTPFRGLVSLGRRNLVPILPPAHPLWGGLRSKEQDVARYVVLRIPPLVHLCQICIYLNTHYQKIDHKLIWNIELCTNHYESVQIVINWLKNTHLLQKFLLRQTWKILSHTVNRK